MKKKTKERLDRIEKRLERLAEDIQKLKGPMHGTQSVKKKDVAAKTTRAKKVATNTVGNTRKAEAAKKVVVAKKAEVAPGSGTARKTLKKLAPELAKKKVAAKDQRPANAKPAVKSVPKPAPKSKMKITKPGMLKDKTSVATAAVVPVPRPVTSVISEAGKGGEFPG